MRERPILFSGAMVKAILAGTKTVTRRIVHPRMYLVVDGDEDTGRVVNQSDDDFGALATEYARCPYGAPGDSLWVRETFAHVDDHREHGGGCVQYRADVRDDYDAARIHGPWKPSIFMPRWASRITLEVTSVRVERLDAITERDALAEGVAAAWPNHSARFAFRDLWESINAKRAPWSSNPWVWRVAFSRPSPGDGR